jgi:hypothetical protein
LLFVVVCLQCMTLLTPEAGINFGFFFPLFFCKDWSFLHNCWRWIHVFPTFFFRKTLGSLQTCKTDKNPLKMCCLSLALLNCSFI